MASSPTTRGGEIVAAAGSARITGQVMPWISVPLAQLAPHPENPRRDVGDVSELAASIAELGVLEPLIVLTAAAYVAAAEADGVPARPGPGITHVIVLGHRRAAGAGRAGLARVPAVVRDDLAGARALAAMIAENLHREALTPLAEAAGMAELARRGWRQRRIAQEIGCSQAHVSKRMALLQLPAAARDALADGRLTVSDALELHQLLGAGDGAEEAIATAVTAIERGQGVRHAISQAREWLRREQRARATRAKLEADGVKIVTEKERGGHGWPRVWSDLKPHADAGCLAAVISFYGDAEYVCTSPGGHTDQVLPGGRHAAREAADQREGRKAANARSAACAKIAAGPLPSAGDLARVLTSALLTGGGGHADALQRACRWLADAGIAPPGADHYQWRDQLAAASDDKTLARFAYAYALAADESIVRCGYSAWGDRHTAHLARLAGCGYEPTTWEQERLAEVAACAQARGTLACTTCGCASGPEQSGCRVRFDRDLGQPVHECAWNCDRHRATETRRHALENALETLFEAVCRQEAIAEGEELSAGLTAAIEGARDRFCQLYSEPWPDDDDQPPGELAAAADDLRRAALPYEDAWPPRLRAALEAFAKTTGPADSAVDSPDHAGRDSRNGAALTAPTPRVPGGTNS
jgi:ParB family chromosome partitioning protein